MLKETILFSIVVPVYNVDQYLKKCVNSVLEQTYNNFELILVDDGSTDTCAQICDEYEKKDKRVKVIHKKNGGLVSARKAGIKIAKGDYAICIDSDDWVKNSYLQELTEIIYKYEPDIICFNHYIVNEEKQNVFNIPFRKGLYTKQDLNNIIYPQLIGTEKSTSFPPTIWAKVYKRELYKSEQLLVDERIKIGEDVACTIPCMISANSIYILDKALYYYRRNASSMTKNRKPFSWDDPELIEIHLRNRIKNDDMDFQNQISRRTVHALVNVVKTQFYSSEKYSVIKKKIKKELSRKIYKEALRESKFKGRISILACQFFLIHNIFFPFYLLSKKK